MCANCGCGYAWYDDIETGANANSVKPENEMTEKEEM